MSYLQPAAPAVDMLAQVSRCLFETAQAKVIQERQIHLPLSSSQCLSLAEVSYPPSWTFKDCSWPAFFTGTLTPAASIASLEQMRPEENKASRPGG